MISRKPCTVLSGSCVLVLSLLAMAAVAQPPAMVVDLNTTVKKSSLSSSGSFASMDGELYFVTDDAVHGGELWRTDGSGAVLLKDICPGACGFRMGDLTRVGNRILFFADDGEHGLELWATDGTSAGTALVKDIWPGLEGGAFGAWILEVDGTIFFPANDGLLGQELWKSDGTAAGTVLVADLRPGAEGSIPVPHVAAGGTVILDADDGIHGREPWLTDGTAAGTRLLADIRQGLAGSIDQFSRPDKTWLATSGGRFLFVADDGNTGPELWASDGTESGTILVQDFRPGTMTGFPSQLTELAGSVYLSAGTDTHGSELWKTDGTPAGTSLVKDIAPGSANSLPQEITVFAGRLVFRANDQVHGAELWTSDGTEAGTVMVKDIATASNGAPRGMTVVAGQLLFFADQGTNGLELWRSDGTEAGTVMVTDFGGQALPALALLNFDVLAVESRFYFRAADLTGDSDHWVSDGTAAGTILVLNGRRLTSSIFVGPWDAQVSEPSGWGALGEKLIFQADNGTTIGNEPWVSDGTPAGTRNLADAIPGPEGVSIFNLTPFGSGALFSSGLLWKTDGTPAGTNIVLTGPTAANGLTRIGGTVLFSASSSAAGFELWKTDGTAAGTAQLRDILPGTSGSDPRRLTGVGARIYFKANGGPGSNQELWTSDGTAAGTALVEDIRPGAEPSELDHLTAVAGRLFFTANDGASGREPWVSDGTAAGTFRVKDIVPGAGSSIAPPPANVAQLADLDPKMTTATLGSTFFFLADDGSGEELWASDGTETGTRRVKDIRPGPPGSQPRWLTVAGGRLFFSATDGAHGRELWLTDGTEAGTVMVSDLLPGAGSSLPRELAAAGDAIVFSATDGVHGVEPWASNGTWTRFLGDLAPGTLPSSPTRFTIAGDHGKVYFTANDGTTGFELWSTTVNPLDFHLVAPCRVTDTRPSAPLLTGQTRTIPVAGTCGIPADAMAVAVTFTAITPNGPGNLTAWKTGTPKPGTSALNYAPGATRSNNGIVELGTGGRIDVQGQTFVENGQVHFVLDVTGYFR